MVDIKELEDKYFVNGYDVIYTLASGKEIKIKPILVKDYLVYKKSSIVLDINKNEINDIQVIQMSYLEFLVNVIFPNYKDFIKYIEQIFSLCLNENKVTLGKSNGKLCFVILNDDDTIKYKITSKDFANITQIILNQNDAKRDNRNLSKDVKEAYEEYCKLKYKDINPPSLEKQKAFVISKTGYKLSEINNMTYRMFYLIYQSCIDSEIYMGEKIIQSSLKYECKQNIVHPQFKKEIDPITEMFSDAESFERKINSVNG